MSGKRRFPEIVPRLPPRPGAFALLVGLVLAVTAGCGEGDRAAAPDPTLDPRGGPEAEAGAARDPGADLPEGAQARSLLGDILFAPPLDDDLRGSREDDLAAAIAERDSNPGDPEAWIWVGRHQAYLGEYRRAIRTFSEGLDRFPDDARFLRHRGHRHLTVREFDRAVGDLSRGIEMAGDRAAEIEPDGLPNPLGVPLTTLGFNLWYHRALAEYLQGDFEAARDSWRATLEVSDNPDLEVASRYWLHLTLRRLGADATEGDEGAARDDREAARVLEPVDETTEVIENATYRDLVLLFRGDRTVEELLDGAEEGLATVTLLYGIAMHHLLQGETEEGRARLQQILERADQWPAFGYIAAEAEVARIGR